MKAHLIENHQGLVIGQETGQRFDHVLVSRRVKHGTQAVKMFQIQYRDDPGELLCFGRVNGEETRVRVRTEKHGSPGRARRFGHVLYVPCLSGDLISQIETGLSSWRDAVTGISWCRHASMPEPAW